MKAITSSTRKGLMGGNGNAESVTKQEPLSAIGGGVLRLVISETPPSLNKVLRMHWAKKRGLLQAWRWMIRATFVGSIVCNGKRRVKITLHHSRLYDKDNAYGACKVIFDALKAEGFIVDDRKEWLEATVEQEKCPHKERHTIVEIEPA